MGVKVLKLLVSQLHEFLEVAQITRVLRTQHDLGALTTYALAQRFAVHRSDHNMTTRIHLWTRLALRLWVKRHWQSSCQAARIRQ